MTKKANKEPRKLWIVVHVMSGIPAAVKVFHYKQSAVKYEKKLRKHLNLNNDETGIFEVKL